MVRQIREWFNSYANMTHAVHYLTNHINYHLINNRDTEFIKLSKMQLRFLVIARWGLSDKQINKVVNLACNNAVSSSKASLMVTRSAIYLAVC